MKATPTSLCLLIRINGVDQLDRGALSGRGNGYDNAMVETFFKAIKSELNQPVAWQSRKQAENAIARYIDGFYNHVRRHSSLGFQSPIAFARKAREVS